MNGSFKPRIKLRTNHLAADASLFLPRPNFRIIILILIAFTVLAVLPMSLFDDFLFALFGAVFLWVVLRYLWLGILMLLLMDNAFFSFILPSEYPSIHLASHVTVNIQDILIIVMLFRSVLVLMKRRERPHFLVPVLVLWGVMQFSFVFGLISGTADMIDGIGLERIALRYGLYFIVISAVDSRRSLKVFIRIIYAFAAIGLVLQFVELARGEYIYHAWFGTTPYHIMVAGKSVSYVWNRAQPYLLISICMLFSVLLFKRHPKLWQMAFLGVAVWGVLIMLVRSNIIFMFIAVVTMFLFIGKRRVRVLVLLGILALGFQLVPSIQKEEAVQSVLGRTKTLLSFAAEENFAGRADIWKGQISSFLQSPVFGLGPGYLALQSLNVDTGLPNTLVLYGITGFLAVIILIGAMVRQAYKMLKLPALTEDRVIGAGMVGTIAGMAIVYGFSIDYFTTIGGIILPILVMALLDRGVAAQYWVVHRT